MKRSAWRALAWIKPAGWQACGFPCLMDALAKAECIQTETFVLPGQAAMRREGKGIHFVEIERFLRRMDALPSRFALAEHDNIDSI
jgi:hypothetical protein